MAEGEAAVLDAPVVEETSEAPVALSSGRMSIPWSLPEETPAESTDAAAPTPTDQPATTAPVQEAPPDPGSQPDAAPSAKKLRDLLGEAPEDEVADLLNDARLKRRIDGMVGGKLQQERQRIAEETRREIQAEDQLVAAADARLAEIEALEYDNPDEYERITKSSEFKRWSADLSDLKEARVKRNSAPAAQSSKDVESATADAVATYNSAVSNIVHGAIQKAPWYGELTPAARTAIESAATSPGDGSWVEKVLSAYASHTNTHWTKKMNDAVAAAREAAKNETIASSEVDAPLTPDRPTDTRSADDIIRDYGLYGSKNGTSLADYQRAAKSKNW